MTVDAAAISSSADPLFRILVAVRHRLLTARAAFRNGAVVIALSLRLLQHRRLMQKLHQLLVIFVLKYIVSASVASELNC